MGQQQSSQQQSSQQQPQNTAVYIPPNNISATAIATPVVPISQSVKMTDGLYRLPSNYVKCSDQNNTCSFTGDKTVAYTNATSTTPGVIYYKNASNNISCNDTTFGDPAIGKSKTCYISHDSEPLYFMNGEPIGYTKCSSLNGSCNFSGGIIDNVDIVYGANGTFVRGLATNGNVNCDEATFGKPNISAANCYYRAK